MIKMWCEQHKRGCVWFACNIKMLERQTAPRRLWAVRDISRAGKPRATRAPRYLYAMLLRPEYLSQKLDRPLPTKDGGTLRTIGEAVDYMTNVGKKRELQGRWQRVAKLVLAKEDVLTVSRALELALFMDAKLDVSKL
jgi:hypothetical protein